ncbi:hypothetical protein JCM5350_002090 [Sporobolomyces pararoseus]
MVQTSSTSSALVAILALTSVLSESATALPTHRSSSAITRRAHILSHYDSPLPLNKRTDLGDHSVYVDASTSQPGGNGGVRNSTINLTVVSSKRDSTLSSFSRVVRSFFRRSTTTPSSSTPSSSSTVPPRLVALPQHTAAPYTKGHRTSRKQHQAAAALSRRNKINNKRNSKRSLPEHPSPRIGVVVPKGTRPKNIKRNNNNNNSNKLVERQANYSVGNEQASIYAAAVAALVETGSAPPPPQVTAQPVALNFNAAADSIDSPNLSSAASLPPITLTMTLIPGGPNGEYIDAALPTSTTLLASSSSSSSDSLSTTPSAIPFPSSEKLRQKRSNLSDRKKRHFEQKRSELVKPKIKDTSRLKRFINPKTGSISPSSSTSTTIIPTTPTPASQVVEQPPKWIEIARF